MSAALIKHEQIVTTLPKAKGFARSWRSWSRSARRAASTSAVRPSSELRDLDQVKKLFDVRSALPRSRQGGYTRIIKAGFRYGDNAPMAVIEFVDRDEDAKGQDSGPVQAKEAGGGVKAAVRALPPRFIKAALSGAAFLFVVLHPPRQLRQVRCRGAGPCRLMHCRGHFLKATVSLDK